MLIGIDVVIPDDIMAAPGVDTRYTFRRTVENRLRPRMNALLKQVEQDTIYPSIADYFLVEQITTADSVGFALENIHPAARYLEASEGTKPHTITQEAHVIPLGNLEEFFGDLKSGQIAQFVLANREIVIEHPGTEPDRPVQDDIADAEQDMIDAGADALDVWAQRFGVEAV